MHSYPSPAGRLKSHQKGFWIETPFQMQKTKALRWLFPGRHILILGGTHSGNTRGETWDLTRTCPSDLCRMTLSRVGFLTLAPGIPTPVFWPGEFLGLDRAWGCKGSDTTVSLSLSFYWSLFAVNSAKVDFSTSFLKKCTSLVAQQWRICLPIQETLVQSLGQEDPLLKKMAIHFSILAWEIP